MIHKSCPKEDRECKICGKSFAVFTGSKKQRASTLRSRKSLTCSKECSRENEKLIHRNFIRKKDKKTKETLSEKVKDLGWNGRYYHEKDITDTLYELSKEGLNWGNLINAFGKDLFDKRFKKTGIPWELYLQ